MPDTRTHRGPHPEDIELFSLDAQPVLREAAADLAWLLGRGYAGPSSLKLVGDRYQLAARQRKALSRAACSEAELARRHAHQVGPEQLIGSPLRLDGYNVLTTIEAALAGGVILVGRDGTCRDMASMHGSYRKVAETVPALELLGQLTHQLGVSECLWYLDRPVSNSGRLKKIIEAVAARHGWNWQAELVSNPDALLVVGDQVIASADSAVLDRCAAWFNLARETIARHVPGANLVSLYDQ